MVDEVEDRIPSCLAIEISAGRKKSVEGKDEIGWSVLTIHHMECHAVEPIGIPVVLLFRISWIRLLFR